MKRVLLICVISVLLVSGWSHVLAAVICPQMRTMSSCPMMQRGDKPVPSHETMEMGEMGDMQMSPGVTEGESNLVEQPFGSCPHCFRQSQPITTSAVATKRAEQTRRDIGALLRRSVKALTLPDTSFAAPVTSRQHAPPLASAPRHVLISIFLI